MKSINMESSMFLVELSKAVGDFALTPSREMLLGRYVIPIGSQFDNLAIHNSVDVQLDHAWIKQQVSNFMPKKDEILKEIMLQGELEALFSPIYNKVLSREEIIKRRDIYVNYYCNLFSLSSSDFLFSIFIENAQIFEAGTIVLLDKKTSAFLIMKCECLSIVGSVPVVNVAGFKSVLRSMSKSQYSASLLDQLLGVLNTLTFAMPPPWGIFVRAGFQLVQALIGSLTNGGALNSMARAVEAAVNVAFSKHDLKGYAADLSAYMSQLNRFLNVLDQTPDNIDYINSEILPFLRSQKINVGSGTIYNGFQQILEKQYCLPQKPNDPLAPLALQVLAQLAAAIALNQRTLVVLVAQVASFTTDQEAHKHLTNIWLGEYVELSSLLVGSVDTNGKDNSLAAILTTVSKKVVDQRLNKLTISWGVAQQAGVVEINDTWTGYYAGGHFDGLYSQTYDEWAQSWHNQYGALYSTASKEVNGLVDKNFAGVAIAKKFQDIINSWDVQLKPKEQDNTTEVAFKNNAQDAYWKNVQKVSYIIRFSNAQGFVEIKPTSIISSSPGKNATLSNIPVDKLFLTHTKDIIRVDSNGTRKTVGTVENAVTTFEDD